MLTKGEQSLLVVCIALNYLIHRSTYSNLIFYFSFKRQNSVSIVFVCIFPATKRTHVPNSSYFSISYSIHISFLKFLAKLIKKFFFFSNLAIYVFIDIHQSQYSITISIKYYYFYSFTFTIQNKKIHNPPSNHTKKKKKKNC